MNTERSKSAFVNTTAQRALGRSRWAGCYVPPIVNAAQTALPRLAATGSRAWTPRDAARHDSRGGPTDATVSDQTGNATTELRREGHGLALVAVYRDVERCGDPAAGGRVRDAVAHIDRVGRRRQRELDV